MSDQIRFTPDEIQELVASGDLKEADLAKMHPADAQVAVSAMLKGNKFDIKGAPMPPPGLAKMATGLMSGKDIGGLGDTLKTVGKLWAMNKGLDYAGAPSEVKTAVMLALGLRGGSKGAPAAAAEEGPLMGRTSPGQPPFEIGAGSRSIMQNGRPPTPPPDLRMSTKDALSTGDTTPVKGGLDVDSMSYPSNVQRLKPGSGASFNQQPTPGWEDSRNIRLQDRPDEGEMDRLLMKIKSLLDARSQ